MSKNKRFLHIIPPSKRMMNTYMNMIRKNFDTDNHTFMFFDACSKNDEVLFEYENVRYLSESGNWLKRYKAMYDMYKEYDYVIWHGFLYGGMYMLFLYVFRFCIKKTIWVMRGIDLYNWKQEKGGLKEKIINHVNYYVRKKIHNVISIFPTDVDVYKKQFKTKANIYCIPYPMSEQSFEEMEELAKRKKRLNGETWIQICNNSYPFNNHLKILKYISKFNNENVKLFIPLSYGNDYKNVIENYQQTVENNYIDEFGEEKVNILRRLMPADEYTRLICNMDIAIFGAYRQNALGNMLRQMYIGNKVFISNKNPLYKYFKDIGIDIFCIEDIENMSFEQFKSESNILYSQYWLKSNFHPDYNYNAWNKLFESVEMQKKNKEFECFVYKTDNDKGIVRENNNSVKENSNSYDYKSNFVQICKYTSQDKRMLRQYNNLKNLYIIGDSKYSKLILQTIYIENMINYRYIPMGIISEDILNMDNLPESINIVGTLDDYIKIKTENDYIVTAIMDPNEREKAVSKLLEKSNCASKEDKIKDINFGYIDILSKAGYNVSKGYGRCISYDSYIGSNTDIGNHTYIFGSKVGSGCVIGDYVTLKTSTTICDNVIIGDKVIIGEGSIIYPNVTISEGTIIPIGSIIKESI